LLICCCNKINSLILIKSLPGCRSFNFRPAFIKQIYSLASIISLSIVIFLNIQSHEIFYPLLFRQTIQYTSATPDSRAKAYSYMESYWWRNYTKLRAICLRTESTHIREYVVKKSGFKTSWVCLFNMLW
jgi:hypothetical protein